MVRTSRTDVVDAFSTAPATAYADVRTERLTFSDAGIIWAKKA